MMVAGGKHIGPMAADDGGPIPECLPCLCRWRHADQVPIKPDIGPTVGRRICQQLTNVVLPTKCRSNPTLAWQQADGHANTGPTSGCQLNADQMPMKPDIGPTMSRRACRHLADVGFSTLSLMSGCPPNADQMPTKPDMGGSTTLTHLDIGLMSLCRRQADDVPSSGRCTYVDIQLMLYWHLANVVSMNCRWRADFPMMAAGGYNMKCGPQDKKHMKNMKSKCSNLTYLLYKRTTLHMFSLHD